MSQIALPLSVTGTQGRIVVGDANAGVVESLQHPQSWPYRTAILAGPPRSGKTLLARWFGAQPQCEAIDDADRMDETALFHRWNAAQENGTALLLTVRDEGWEVALPDLRSRLGAAMHLAIGSMDDAFAGDLIDAHAEQRGLALGDGAKAYLVPRCERGFADIEALVAAIDRLSLERKQPATLSIWRDALADLTGRGVQTPLL